MAWEPSTSRSVTVDTLRLGTSTPTSALPGMGASMRTDLTSMFMAMFLPRSVTLVTLMPAASSSSNREMAGPWVTWRTLAGTLKDCSVSSSRWERMASSSSLMPAWGSGALSRSMPG